MYFVFIIMQTFDFDALYQAWMNDELETCSWLDESDVTIEEFVRDANCRIESALQDGKVPDEVHVWIFDQAKERGLVP